MTLDPDVADKLKAYAHRGKLSFKQALNELLRRGLQVKHQPRDRPRFEIIPHDGTFRPGIEPARLNQLLDDLEMRDFVREIPRRE